MSFKMVLLPPYAEEAWEEEIRQAVPNCDVTYFPEPAQAMKAIEDADVAYGTVPPELFARAKKLRWIAGPRAGLGADWFYDALVNSDVVVTNASGVYNDHLSHHIMGFLLALSRRLDQYMVQQQQRQWKRAAAPVFLPGSTALIIGVGGSGAEAAKLCAAFGMRVVGVDPKTPEPPPGMAYLHRPEALDGLLGSADFVILTAPETPQTRGMINARRFRLMKPTAYIINIGRGVCVVLDDLVAALQSQTIAGAGLDVFQVEPLPPDHPLWTMPGVLITPHMAISSGAQLYERRVKVLLENCRRFARGEPLVSVVDKASWY